MALKLENITYKNIIKDINYKFEDGKIYTVLSSNEIERETLGKIIANLINNYSGKIISDYTGDNINYVYSNPEDMFIGDNCYKELSLPLAKYNYKKETVDKKIDLLLKMFYLDDNIKNIKSSDLSSGEKRLISIGISFMSNPKIIVLDNPTLYLDDYNEKILIKILKKIAKEYNKIIIMFTNDVLFSYKSSDNYLLLNNGSLLSDGRTKNLPNINDKLLTAGLSIPKIMNFIDNAHKKKNISLDKTYDIKELMKDIYRNVK